MDKQNGVSNRTRITAQEVAATYETNMYSYDDAVARNTFRNSIQSIYLILVLGRVFFQNISSHWKIVEMYFIYVNDNKVTFLTHSINGIGLPMWFDAFYFGKKWWRHWLNLFKTVMLTHRDIFSLYFSVFLFPLEKNDKICLFRLFFESICLFDSIN